jgi:hypothetical protein
VGIHNDDGAHGGSIHQSGEEENGGGVGEGGGSVECDVWQEEGEGMTTVGSRLWATRQGN